MGFFLKVAADPPGLCPMPLYCPALSTLRMTFVFLQTTSSLPLPLSTAKSSDTCGIAWPFCNTKHLGDAVRTVCFLCGLVLGDSSGYKHRTRPISVLVHRRPSPGAQFSCSDPPTAIGLLLARVLALLLCSHGSLLCATCMSSDTERHP
jgi:hypothetical protein